ncbi:cytochrome c-type biogenesis protein CcmG/DsbE, thiol:disulfide oxidoreductase [Candidatus Pelagibacter sp. IMCC9063]|uniref:DsbE family thiol:disulfide interchange protein n=1 Tax=Pelagibacter sp. (strain IMCC9063) TaxID=1002672 RepID=UPI00020467E1|nr:DsbE family thiol:disulfide interchange protein [Candidatus Pelagibacter sp. IMCC9063]AEA80920.1 cytochrome c-type biogenesis protein CcmG/DsbE, thiol:disulfide oxidoreductase [Candidatus Pelagibacter sp. IMCC9063]|tara:strand:- start:150 stop:665 length:516 start_codon:yes stop_codon:yes gene_type:complete
MKKQFKISLFVSIIVIFFVIFYHSLKANNKNNPNVMLNKVLPTIELTSFTNSNLKQVMPIINKDKYYLINIWSSWCVPCREEHPILMKLKNKIKIYGINYKDKKTNATSFLNKLGNPFYFTGSDKDGSVSIEIGAYGIPETYVVNSQGLIVFKHVGPLNKKIYLRISEMIK